MSLKHYEEYLKEVETETVRMEWLAKQWSKVKYPDQMPYIQLGLLYRELYALRKAKRLMEEEDE